MALTTEQRAIRRQRIGSSDAAAICGASPLHNAADIYWSKIGELEDRPTEEQELGNDVQGMLCQWAAKQLDQETYEPDVWCPSPAGLPIAANLDGRLGDTDRTILEAKSTSWPGAWGEPEVEDDVPEGILMQLAIQFHCSPESRRAVVPRFAGQAIPSGGYKIARVLYRAARHDDFIKEVVSKCMEFWNKHVVPRVPPAGEVPHLETLKRVRRMPKTVAEVHDPQAAVDIAAWQEAIEDRKTSEKAAEEAQARVLAHMGTAEAMLCGNRYLSYLWEGTDHPVTYLYRARRVLRLKKR